VVDLPPPHPTPGTHSRLSRRSVVFGVLGGVAGMAVAGCSDNGDGADKTPGSPAGLTPDVAVATSALTEIRAVREAASATLARFPANRSTLAPLVTLHRAHEATLVDAVPHRASPSARAAPYAVPRKREKALSNLAVREQRLHNTLDALALRAESGQFARLLASMGAALHQRLAGWQP
jgi:hypothetical protein